MSAEAAETTPTCPKAFIPYMAAEEAGRHVDTCDQPAGHAGKHHCPDCDVWWSLASEDTRTRGRWDCEFCRSSFAYLDDAEQHVRRHPGKVNAATPGQADVRAAAEAHDRLSDVIRAEMGGCDSDGCEECTIRFSAILESAEEYARAVAAARERPAPTESAATPGQARPVDVNDLRGDGGL